MTNNNYHNDSSDNLELHKNWTASLLSLIKANGPDKAVIQRILRRYDKKAH